MITFAWLWTVPRRRSGVIEGAAVVLAVSGLVEVGLIAMPAARDTTSHYNHTTPFNGEVHRAIDAGGGADASQAPSGPSGCGWRCSRTRVG
jgi:hypothetical protein